MKSVAVIISVYSIDRAKAVLDCIQSIKNQTLNPQQIIVVLDPDEALVTYYKKCLDNTVKIVVSDTFGLSAARNTGIRNSFSEIIVFIDDDAVADSEWLEKLVNNFDDPSVIGVGGRIVPIWPKKSPYWFPEELLWVVGCSYKGLPTKKESIRNPIGCNMAFRHNLFEKIGYFSTNIGRIGNNLLGHEDTEFAARTKNTLPEAKILYDPEALVYHRISLNRVNVKYVFKRSYAEGASKAFVSDINAQFNFSSEKQYLKNLILNTPRHLFRFNLLAGVSKIIILWISTEQVLLGFFAGLKLKRKKVYNKSDFLR